MLKVVPVILLTLLSFSTLAGDLPNVPFVYSEGSTSIDIKPDYATLSFYFDVEDSNDNRALKKIALLSNEVDKLLIDFKIEKEDYENELSKSTDYTVIEDEETDKRKTILIYEYSRSYIVTLNDLKKYPEFFLKLMKLNNITVEGAYFNSSSYEKHLKDLKLKAINSARKEAELMAKAAGTEIVGVYAISEISFDNISSNMLNAGGGFDDFEDDFSDEYDEEEELDVEVDEDDLEKTIKVPSHITLSASVNMIFKIK